MDPPGFEVYTMANLLWTAMMGWWLGMIYFLLAAFTCPLSKEYSRYCLAVGWFVLFPFGKYLVLVQVPPFLPFLLPSSFFIFILIVFGCTHLSSFFLHLRSSFILLPIFSSLITNPTPFHFTTDIQYHQHPLQEFTDDPPSHNHLKFQLCRIIAGDSSDSSVKLPHA